MGTFFKPWRRKFGVAALTLACVFTAGWVRSGATVDYITLTACHWPIQVSSNSGQFTAIVLNTATSPFWHGPEWTSFDLDARGSGGWPRPIFYYFELADVERRVFMNTLVIPYRTLVVPLTLLSAYLLLSKRKRNTESDSATSPN